MTDPARRRQQLQRRRLGLCCTAVLLGLVVVALVLRRDEVVAALTVENLRSGLDDTWLGLRATALNGWYWLFVAGALLLERIHPARKEESAFSPSGATDLAWVVLSPIWSLTVVALYLAVLNLVYASVFGGFSFELDERVGATAAIVIAFLVADFNMWFTHLVRHKVPTFWYFHAVHHSQRRMNTMTDWRVHFAESMIASTLVYIPAQLVGVGSSASAILAFATVYFTGFTHTNVRTNLGPLRWLLVTPQSHRVHHSYAPEHIDTNFGAVLSIWDRIFRTQYLGEDEYPVVGISDPDFPLEQSARPDAVLATYLRQQVYPFRQIAADVGRLRRAEVGVAHPQLADAAESG